MESLTLAALNSVNAHDADQLTMLMRKTARDILESGQADRVIGWEQGTFNNTTTPVFITDPHDSERLVWNEYCINNLAKYLLDYVNDDGKTALFVKGCDARAVNRLIQDKQISRDKLILIGLSCPGMKDTKNAKETRRPHLLKTINDTLNQQVAALQSDNNAGIPLAQKCREDVSLAQKCRECRYPDPVIYDVFLGEKYRKADTPANKDYTSVEQIEGLEADEKYQLFAGNYQRCLRCYACRNVCSACSCRECIFGDSSREWSGKAVNLSENMFFAMTRALHVAGRCIDCGECERVCPVNIPIMLLNKKFSKDIDTLFGDYDGGIDPEDKLPLGGFEFTDPEEFM